MTRIQLIEMIAEYFTGYAVGANSINLQIPGQQKAAQQYFDLRSAFGVDRYDSKGVAMKAIARRLRQGRVQDVNEHGEGKAK